MGGLLGRIETVERSEGTEISLGSHDRLLVLAPHPDDETLGTGGLIQHAVASGAEVVVAFITAGENNAWAQRAIELRPFISAADRERFGHRRRREVEAALKRLAVPAGRAVFLGFPDQGLTDRLLDGGEPLVGELTALLSSVAPTTVAYPFASDRHPDHSALAVATRLALARRRGAPPPTELCYVVHNPALRGLSVEGSFVRLDPRQLADKRAAIRCHVSQMVWRRSWMLSFSAPVERYLPPQLAVSAAGGPIRAVSARDGELELNLLSRNRPFSFGSRTLLVGVERDPDRFEVLICTLRRGSGRLPLRRPAGGALALGVGFEGSPHRGAVRLPGEMLAGARRLFVKLERRFGFFDEAGWLEVALPPTDGV